MDMWYDISGYKGMYQISEDRIVRSLDRIVNGRKVHGKTLNGPNLSRSVRAIKLSRDGERKSFSLDELYELRIISKQSPITKVKVKCVDEDREFPSETAASIYYGMHVSSVSDSIHDGKYHCGHKFIRI